MTEIILKTGWKHWDQYLSKFVGKKINCLDIGSYTGDSTCWMLNNLCTNQYSRVFSIDTWEGSPEYTNYTSEIENKFDEAVEKTGKKDQHVKMKMSSSKALFKLKEFGFIIFDFIFIDASHEARDVITDAILSWDILNNEGILIFDDYKWDKLKEEHYRPKIAIDSFVQMFKQQLKTLYIGYQYIIEKIQIRENDKPELTDYYKLIDQINKYKYDNFEYIYEDVINEEILYKLEMSIEPKEEIRIIPQINKNINNHLFIEKIFNINDSSFYKYFLEKTFDNKIINNILLELNISIDVLLLFVDIPFIKILIYKNNNTQYFFINDEYLNNNIIKHIYKHYNINNKIKITFNNIIIDNNIIFNKLISYSEKYNFILFGYNSKLHLSDNKFKYISLLIYIAVAINIQKKEGTLMIYVPYYINYNIVSQSIYLLKKYYKSIKIINRNTTNIGINYILICTNFLTIDNNKKNQLNVLINNIFNNINNKIYYINSFLNVSNNIYENDIKLIINNKYKKIMNLLYLYNKTYSYINKNKIYNLQLLIFKKIITNLLYNFSKI